MYNNKYCLNIPYEEAGAPDSWAATRDTRLIYYNLIYSTQATHSWGIIQVRSEVRFECPVTHAPVREARDSRSIYLTHVDREHRRRLFKSGSERAKAGSERVKAGSERVKRYREDVEEALRDHVRAVDEVQRVVPGHTSHVTRHTSHATRHTSGQPGQPFGRGVCRAFPHIPSI